MQKVFPLEKWIEVGRCCHLNIFSLQSERGLKWDLEGLDAPTTEEVTWSNQRGHIKQLDSKSFRSAGISKNTFLRNRKCHQRWHIKRCIFKWLGFIEIDTAWISLKQGVKHCHKETSFCHTNILTILGSAKTGPSENDFCTFYNWTLWEIWERENIPFAFEMMKPLLFILHNYTHAGWKCIFVWRLQ